MKRFSLFLESADEIAFIERIFASPFDVTNKLVFADWLNDNGKDDLGNFLRLACGFSRNRRWQNSEGGQFNSLKTKIHKDFLNKKKTSIQLFCYHPDIFYDYDSKNWQHYIVFNYGLYRKIDNRLAKCNLGEVPEEILDAVVYVFAYEMVKLTHETDIDFYISRHAYELGRIASNFPEYTGEYEIREFVIRAEELLMILKSDSEFKKKAVMFGNLRVSLRNFIDSVRENPGQVVGVGADELIELSNKLLGAVS